MNEGKRLEIQLDRLVEVLLGVLSHPKQEQDHATVEVGEAVKGIDRDRSCIVRPGGFQFSLPKIGIASVVVGVSPMRIQCKHMVVVADGLIEFLKTSPRVASSVVGRRKARVDLDCASEI